MPQSISVQDIAAAFPAKAADSHKKHFGHVWIFGGSTGFSGAPQLAAFGAMAADAGLVSIACSSDVYPIIASHSLETMVHPQTSVMHSQAWIQANALLAGPGWGQGQEQSTILSTLLASTIPLILDADALHLLAENAQLQRQLRSRDTLTILTPHPGEAAHLLGCSNNDIQHDRATALQQLLDAMQCWVVLKGQHTCIGAPNGDTWQCNHGSPNLARAGTGDVLAGMIAGIVGRNIPAHIAIPAAVVLHAKAGEQSHWYRAGQLPDMVHQLKITLSTEQAHTDTCAHAQDD